MENQTTWRDSSEDSCEMYGKGKFRILLKLLLKKMIKNHFENNEADWCTGAGSYGKNWDPSWGKIENYAKNGFSALNCIECGCIYEKD